MSCSFSYSWLHQNHCVPHWSLQKYIRRAGTSQNNNFLTTNPPSLITRISDNYTSVVFFLFFKKVISSVSTLWSFRENRSFSELGRFAEIHRNAHHSSCSTDMHRVLSYLISTPWMLLSIIQLGLVCWARKSTFSRVFSLFNTFLNALDCPLKHKLSEDGSHMGSC